MFRSGQLASDFATHYRAEQKIVKVGRQAVEAEDCRDLRPI